MPVSKEQEGKVQDVAAARGIAAARAALAKAQRVLVAGKASELKPAPVSEHVGARVQPKAPAQSKPAPPATSKSRRTAAANARPPARPRAKAKASLPPAGPGVVGIDPHKRALTATVLDWRGGSLGARAFPVSGEGHQAMEAWALGFGPVGRWGVEGASGVGRHTAAYLAAQGHDVRDVCPNRTNERRRARQGAKSDAEDSLRIAREVLANPGTPAAFKRTDGSAGPDEGTELLGIWHNARRWARDTTRDLLNRAESLLYALPEQVRSALPDTPDVRVRLHALAKLGQPAGLDAPAALRLRLLRSMAAQVDALGSQEREATRELARLTKEAGSTLDELSGISTRSAAELLVQSGDPRRFAGEGSFARFNGTAPLAASSAEGDHEPKRYRLNRGGNRHINAVLHRMAVTQLRCDPRAQQLFQSVRERGHTKAEAMRVLKRHLSNVVYRRMLADLERKTAAGSTKPKKGAVNARARAA